MADETRSTNNGNEKRPKPRKVHSPSARPPEPDSATADAPKSTTRKAPQAFVDLLDSHLERLGWTRLELAKRCKPGVSTAQISGWSTHNRSVSLKDVNRVALAITLGYEKKKPDPPPSGEKNPPPPYSGLDDLDLILNELLTAAGYAAKTGRQPNLIWAEFAGTAPEKRTLRVGWSELPNLAEKGPAGRPQGIAVKTVDRIAELLEISNVEWKPYECLGDLISAVREGAIDLVAPILLGIPSRMLDVAFSEPLPRLRVGYNGILAKTEWDRRKNELLKRTTDTTPPIDTPSPERGHRRKRTGFRPRKFLVNYVRGGVGDIARSLFLQGAAVEERHSSSIPEALKYVLSQPYDSASRKVRCLVSDELTCYKLWQDRPDQREPLLYPGDANFRLPVVFLTNLGETRLLEAISFCIRLLDRNRFFDGLYQHYKQVLDAGVAKLSNRSTKTKRDTRTPTEHP